MQQGWRHPHRHLDQSIDRNPQIRGPLYPYRSRLPARGHEPRVRRGPRDAEVVAPERLHRGPAHPRRPLEGAGQPDGHPRRLHLAHPQEGRHPQETVGDLPRRLHLGPVGLHRAGALRLRRRHRHRLLHRALLHGYREGRRPLPRMDDRRRRTLPAPGNPLHRHRLHHPCHRHGPLHRRQRTLALQRADEVQRRQPGPPVQRRGQALHREDGGHLPRRLPDRERHHGQRVQVPAGSRSRRRDAQRLRERLRMERRRVRHQARRGPQGDD